MSVTLKHSKAKVFFDDFPRKRPGDDVSHYCPGCGHGVVHNLIAEAIDDFNIADRVLFCSPVGCSVFAYYYLNCGNVQCAHGRAPAVATAIRRTHRDSVVISYQGDGDLAGIGLSHIMHAANRGENITVFFINNAIYGMTGGQMAPTTLLNQKTLTTPMGRSASNDGYPIRVAEIIETFDAPVFIERVSLADGPRVLKARRAIRKALTNQIEKKGFSFVEILSPCPINWKMTPMESRAWVVENLEPVYPVKSFRDNDVKSFVETGAKKTPTHSEIMKMLDMEETDEESVVTKPIDEQRVKIAGFGGQGVLSAGLLLANCAVGAGVKTTWLPSYGPEMRGGTANASVIVSGETIGSPIISHPNVLIAMNGPSLDAFEDKVAPGGTIYVNSSLIKRKVKRDDVKAVYIPATEMAKNLGVPAVANVIILSVYAKNSQWLTVEGLKKMLPIALKRKSLVAANLQAVEAGVSL